MSARLRATGSIGLCVFAILAMGVDSCAVLEEYCNDYDQKADRVACATFCEQNPDFRSNAKHDELVRACQVGQVNYLGALKAGGGSDTVLACDRRFTSDRDLDAACRAGVGAEALRASKRKYGHGTSNDRETGNGH